MLFTLCCGNGKFAQNRSSIFMVRLQLHDSMSAFMLSESHFHPFAGNRMVPMHICMIYQVDEIQRIAGTTLDFSKIENQ